jgi:hypothetical protein
MSLPDRTETREFFPLVSACGFAWRVLRRVRREDLVHAVHVYQLVLQPGAITRQPPQQVTRSHQCCCYILDVSKRALQLYAPH